MATPRPDATGAALTKVDGRLLVAGGSSASAELYGFATVKTDAAGLSSGLNRPQSPARAGNRERRSR